MIKIPLSNSKPAIIDDCDAHLATLTKYKWYLLKGKNKRTGYTYQMFTDSNDKRSGFFLHHLIIGYPLHGLQVDHINGNGLDNRRSNLRIVTRRQNQQNRHSAIIKRKKSKHVGVYWYKECKRWYTQISYHGKQHHVGMFKTEQEAANAYKDTFANLVKQKVISP